MADHRASHLLDADASDEVLVHVAVRDGSERAYRFLVRRHSTRLYRLARRLVGSDTDAEDVVQETWLRAADQLAGFGWRSQLATWLCGITVNVAREVLARRGRWNEDDLTDGDGVIALRDHVGDRMDIERAIATLPSRCRATFLMHDVEGFTHEEIAERLGCTVGTSKTQLFRARRVLRRLLGDTPDDTRTSSYEESRRH